MTFQQFTGPASPEFLKVLAHDMAILITQDTKETERLLVEIKLPTGVTKLLRTLHALTEAKKPTGRTLGEFETFIITSLIREGVSRCLEQITEVDMKNFYESYKEKETNKAQNDL